MMRTPGEKWKGKAMLLHHRPSRNKQNLNTHFFKVRFGVR